MISKLCFLLFVITMVSASDNQPPQETKWAWLTKDGYGTTQEHEETVLPNNVRRGSYGYVDPFGLYRRVNYVADANGFRAQINTNEPGTANRDSADAQVNAQPPPGQPPVNTVSPPGSMSLIPPQPAVFQPRPAAPVFQGSPPAIQANQGAPYWYNQQLAG